MSVSRDPSIGGRRRADLRADGRGPPRRRRRGPRPLAAPAPARGLRQPGAGDDAARGLHRGCAAARGIARPRAARRPAGARQDLAGPHHRRRARVGDRADRRPGAGAQGRHRLLPHRARARLGLLHRRDPPPEPGHRGDALPGDGGPPAADRARPGRRRAHRDPRPAAVHARRRDHARGAADDAASRPVRRQPAARALRARRPGKDRAPLGRHPRGRDRARRASA